MGASSVTGVGIGSADKAGQRGSEHMFMGVEKLIGPRIVAAGIAHCAGNVLTITFPVSLDGVLTDYAIMVTAFSATASAIGAHVTATAVDTSSKLKSFAVRHDEATGVFYWQVVRVSGATVQVD